MRRSVIESHRSGTLQAGVAELADAQDLKSWVPQGACGFEARPRHISKRAGRGDVNHLCALTYSNRRMVDAFTLNAITEPSVGTSSSEGRSLTLHLPGRSRQSQQPPPHGRRIQPPRATRSHLAPIVDSRSGGSLNAEC